MEERALRELRAAVVQTPEDPGAWVALARRLERGGAAPASLGELPLEFLLPAWRHAPHERALLGLFLAARRWSLPSKKRFPPGVWWRRHGRLGEAPDHFYDTATGCPLFVRHDATGLVLARIPPGNVCLGAMTEYLVRVPTARWVATEPLRPSQVATLRAVVQAPASVPEGHGTTWAEATRLLQRLSVRDLGPEPGPLVYRLPSEAEWFHTAGPDPVDEPGDAGRNRWGLARSSTLSEWTCEPWSHRVQDLRVDGLPHEAPRRRPRVVCGGARVRSWSRLRRSVGAPTREPDLSFRYLLGPPATG